MSLSESPGSIFEWFTLFTTVLAFPFFLFLIAFIAALPPSNNPNAARSPAAPRRGFVIRSLFCEMYEPTPFKPEVKRIESILESPFLETYFLFDEQPCFLVYD